MGTIACIIRYEIEFHFNVRPSGNMPATGGVSFRAAVATWLEGTNDIAWGLIAFDSLASYEAYRTRLKVDDEGRANFAMAQEKRFIRREERSFAEVVDGTPGIPVAGDVR